MWDTLVCPFDHRPLAISQWRWLSCTHCGRGYPVLDGIPRLLPPENRAGWVRWLNRWATQAARSPFAAGVRLDDEGRRRLRNRARQWQKALGELFAWDFDTQVLQVSLAGELLVHHFQWGSRFAVNPLAGFFADRGLLRWGRVRWVHAQPEQLPFASQAFELVLLDDVLPWCESPRRALAQAARCLKPQGVLCLWWSQPAEAPTPAASQLPAPGGGRRQFRSVSADRTRTWLHRLGLRVLWESVPESSPTTCTFTLWLCGAQETVSRHRLEQLASLSVSS